MNKIELTREELTTILQVATGNVKDFVMDSDNFIDEQLKAINYIPCCTELNHDFERGEDVWCTEKRIVEISDFCESPDRIEIYEDGKFKIVDKDKLNKVV